MSRRQIKLRKCQISLRLGSAMTLNTKLMIELKPIDHFSEVISQKILSSTSKIWSMMVTRH